ncbi:MAG: hypothetical protein KGL70_03090, partial [Betaproteobacteria bacterium]|nr:hypothetical protein [Betaproteobacteria bacterium]
MLAPDCAVACAAVVAWRQVRGLGAAADLTAASYAADCGWQFVWLAPTVVTAPRDVAGARPLYGTSRDRVCRGRDEKPVRRTPRAADRVRSVLYTTYAAAAPPTL